MTDNIIIANKTFDHLEKLESEYLKNTRFHTKRILNTRAILLRTTIHKVDIVSFDNINKQLEQYIQESNDDNAYYTNIINYARRAVIEALDNIPSLKN